MVKERIDFVLTSKGLAFAGKGTALIMAGLWLYIGNEQIIKADRKIEISRL